MKFIRQLIYTLALCGACCWFGAVSRAQEVTEASLIETLRSAEPAEKAIACKQLAIYGTKEAVPELAKLLGDEQLSSWARIALEAIPDDAANEALRTAAGELNGRVLVGVINSIGVRKDAESVEVLTTRLQDQDPNVASAAAVALGHIGDEAATKALAQALEQNTDEQVRSSVAEGYLLCAERLVKDGNANAAAEIYDQIRQAKLPQPRILEATRGAILARGNEGIELLIEQLRSSDKKMLQIGLTTARELQGAEVANALAGELADAPPERAALLLYALADRQDAAVPPAVFQVARNGEKEVRIAAVEFIGRSGDASSLDTLLEVATDNDPEVAQAAKTALTGLPGEEVNSEIVQLLDKAQGKALPVLIELVGLRRIEATDALIKALEDGDAEVRKAALTALGTTIGPDQVSVLVKQVVSAKNAEDAEVAQRALREAAVRMPDRDAVAAEVAAALQKAPKASKNGLLETLGQVGGQTALESIAVAMKTNDTQLQDTGSRILGDWMSVDAAPVLLDLANTSKSDKYRSRAIRGYIRLARQFKMPDAQRAEICANALAAATKPEERKLVPPVLERYPSIDTLRVAVQATELPDIKQDARRAALAIAQKLDDSAEVLELMAKIGLEPVKLEIIKAEYGAGSQQRDVTEVLQKLVTQWPLVVLPESTYNQSFGGDPAPGNRKELKIQYRIDGQEKEATFAENAAILLEDQNQ